LDTYHPNTVITWARSEDPWLFFEAKICSRAKEFLETPRYLVLKTNILVYEQVHMDQMKQGVYLLARGGHCDSFQYEYEVGPQQFSCDVL
jgi:hypothetical protein